MLFPELTLCGYPPEDLLLHRGLAQPRRGGVRASSRRGARHRGLRRLPRVRTATRSTTALRCLRDGQVLANHRKVALPNYAVFDEKRYFQPGDRRDRRRSRRASGSASSSARTSGCPSRAARPRPPAREAILVINGSPFHRTQQRVREQVLAARARENTLPLVYVNMVGGQDELVFDGGSVVVDAQRRSVQFRAPLFEEGLHVVELERRGRRARVRARRRADPVPPLAERVYRRARARHARLRRQERFRRASCSGCPAASTRR